MPQMLEMAFWNVARTSPTLPPSAISTSAMKNIILSGRLPGARQHHTDIVEDRGDRRVRLVDGDLDYIDWRERHQDGTGDGAGRALQELVIGILEGCGRGRDHVGIGHGVGEAIGARGFRQVDGEFEIDHEALADFGLVFHHAMAGMDDDAADEDRIGHVCFLACSLIAAATRSACTVSATSWVRMMRAPPSAAMRWAAIE